MTKVFINEIHYENIGRDVEEGIEIAGPAGTNLEGWGLHLYTADGRDQGVKRLVGLIPNLQNGFGVIFFYATLPNDRRGNALALVDPSGQLVQFLSWGGVIKGTHGPAAGKQSDKIGVEEHAWFTLPGQSLQLIGRGNTYEDFKWRGPVWESYGEINKGQTFVPAPHLEPVTPPSTEPPPTHAPAPSEPPKPQKVKSIDLYVSKNRAAHHTDKIENENIFAVRRGQEFDIGLLADAVVTQAIVKFQVYPETQKSYSVEVQRAKSENFNPETDWYGYFEGTDGQKSVVTIHVPGRTIVGQYTVTVSGDGGNNWTPPVPLYVLFNAWSKHDDVFLEPEAEKNEYVLGEEGYIWVGSYFNFSPRAWNFAPFHTESVQAALELLKRVPIDHRADVVLISRHLSALVNSQDDKGVLIGNWSSDYSGGTPPTSWTGSAAILKQYNLKKSPVAYGQCWVYSGVLTSICRALGIPARSVTNFASAHDVPVPNYNRSVDTYFRADGTEDPDKTVDSVWNFHVWNDVWFARRDLGDHYRGWQAIDATPQERSERKYQLGPVPVTAVKNGEKDIKYDLEFVYSEVNADEKYYSPDGSGGYKVVRTITNSVGKYMSTKAVGTSARNDVTLEYKYPEGSAEERASIGVSAAKAGGDMDFELEVSTTTKLGEPLEAKLKIDPKKSSGTVNITFSANIVTYTGKQVAIIQTSRTSAKVEAGTPSVVPFVVPADAYASRLKGTDGIIFRAFVSVQPTGQTTIVQHLFDFLADDVDIIVPAADLTVGTEAVATIKFDNPLPTKLTDLVLTVEGQALTKVQRFKFSSLNPKETLSQQVTLKPTAKGKHILIAQLDTAEVNDLGGSVTVVVA